MNGDHDPAPIVQTVQAETEDQLIELAKIAVTQQEDCNWSIGQLASEWTTRFACGRTDEAFAKQRAGN